MYYMCFWLFSNWKRSASLHETILIFQDEIIILYIQQAKEKRAVNLTPKKILHAEEATTPTRTIPDLRLEAKINREVSIIVCRRYITNLMAQFLFLIQGC